MPAMSVYAMKKGSEAVFGAGSNVLVVWKDRLDPKTLISTPNSDVIYALGYVDLKQDGPTVIEVPPKQQGILDDFWQRPICDVGYVGPDKGEGGRYLILPPDFEGQYYLPRVPVLTVAYESYVAEAPQRVADILARARVAIVRGHGVYARGRDLDEAYKWTCSVELSAKTAWLARQAGKVSPSPP